MEYRIAQNFEPDRILKWKIEKDEKIKIPIQKDIGILDEEGNENSNRTSLSDEEKAALVSALTITKTK